MRQHRNRICAYGVKCENVLELACSRSTGNEETTYMPVQQVITGHAGKLTQ